MGTEPAIEPAVRRLAAPAVAAAVGIAGAAVLYLRDPHLPGAYGFCPFHAVTGWWCTGCGGLRAVHDLTHGDVPAALSSNAFAVVMVVAAVAGWVGWARRRWRGAGVRPPMWWRPAAIAVLVALAVFTVLRNTEWGAVLAPN